jgi:hypothetical protein
VAGAGGHERRDPVQRGDLRPGFDHCPPPSSKLGQLTGVDAYGLAPENAPPARRHHVADREPVDPERSELSPTDDAVALRGKVVGARLECGGASSRTHPRTMDSPTSSKRRRDPAVDNGWRVLRALGRSDIPPTEESARVRG